MIKTESYSDECTRILKCVGLVSVWEDTTKSYNSYRYYRKLKSSVSPRKHAEEVLNQAIFGRVINIESAGNGGCTGAHGAARSTHGERTIS